MYSKFKNHVHISSIITCALFLNVLVCTVYNLLYFRYYHPVARSIWTVTIERDIKKVLIVIYPNNLTQQLPFWFEFLKHFVRTSNHFLNKTNINILSLIWYTKQKCVIWGGYVPSLHEHKKSKLIIFSKKKYLV